MRIVFPLTVRIVCACLLSTLLVMTLAITAAAATQPSIPTMTNAQLQQRLLDNAAQGKTTLINIWATWCPPCVAEVPDIVKLRNAYPESQLDILGVSIDDNPRDLVTFMRRIPMNYPVVIDKGDIQIKYRVSSVPMTIVVGPDGKTIHSDFGQLDFKELKEIVEKALARNKTASSIFNTFRKPHGHHPAALSAKRRVCA